jgi:hypothetical protein
VNVVKAGLERELETWVLNCSKCGLDVHPVAGLGVSPGVYPTFLVAARSPRRTSPRSTSRLESSPNAAPNWPFGQSRLWVVRPILSL